MTHTSRQSGSHNLRGAARARGGCLLVPLIVTLCLFAAYKIANRIPQITVPTHTVPADNALGYFHRAYQLSRSRQVESALTVMREGLTHPMMNPAVRTIKSIDIQFGQELRELTITDADAAQFYALNGDPGRAMGMRLDGLEMAVMAPRGLGLMPGLVGKACENFAEKGLEPLLPRLSSSELTEASADLERIAAKRVPYSDIVQEEGYVNAALTLDELRHPSKSPIATAVSQLGIGQNSWTPLRNRVSDSMQTMHEMFVNKGAIIQQDMDVCTALAKAALLCPAYFRFVPLDPCNP